jgi:glycosyltransferase involved in cell wall biosynthesis
MGEVELSFVIPTCEEGGSIENALDKRARLSIVVPAYNEASMLNQNVELIEKVVSLITDSYEIIIAEDGCSDETEKMVANISNNCSKVVHIHSDHRLGKGLALKRALKASKGQAIVFMDADLSTSLDHLHDVVKLVENGYDVAIGSRYVKGSYVRRPLSRAIASRVYNLLVKFLFWDNVSDHQCGFKGFNNQVLKDVIDEVTENGFIFDTELLVRMKSKGLRMIEIPVKWAEPKDRIPKFNLLADGIRMGAKLIKLRFKLWTQRNQKSA